ncbi:MAG: transposase [Bacteroidales bacterium]|jgi:transposase-like protein|nr:transposase [Bacteroidales bacterium]
MDIPKELLSKEFLSQIKSQSEVSQFMKDLHAKVYEQLQESEMDAHLGYEKHRATIQATHATGKYTKQFQIEHGEQNISIPRDRLDEFEPIIVPKHQNRGLSIEKLVISLYAKGMSVSDIEEEMKEIYGIHLSTSAISIITGKISRQAIEWQNRPLESLYLVVS